MTSTSYTGMNRNTGEPHAIWNICVKACAIS